MSQHDVPSSPRSRWKSAFAAAASDSDDLELDGLTNAFDWKEWTW